MARAPASSISRIDVVARGELALDLAAQRAVQVTTVLYPLEERRPPPRPARSLAA